MTEKRKLQNFRCPFPVDYEGNAKRQRLEQCVLPFAQSFLDENIGESNSTTLEQHFLFAKNSPRFTQTSTATVTSSDAPMFNTNISSFGQLLRENPIAAMDPVLCQRILQGKQNYEQTEQKYQRVNEFETFETQRQLSSFVSAANLPLDDYGGINYAHSIFHKLFSTIS